MSAAARDERVLEGLARILPAERRPALEGPAGTPPLPLAAPGTPEEAAEILRLARSERWAVRPIGRGSKLGWSRPPERVDLWLSSRNLGGILSYEPADGTLTAAAGTPWAELVAATAGRHHLSPELPGAGGASVGGVIAAGASGLDRLRHGPLRHQLLGLVALHGDGTRVKSGGRVVKNVTGYDLHRLWCGSQGSLCFLLEASLRLYPAPSEVAAVRRSLADLDEGVALCQALLRAGLLPLALVVDAPAPRARARLGLVLAGRAEALEAELEALHALGVAGEVLRGAAAAALRAELCEGERPGGRWPALVVATRPSRLAGLLAPLAEGLCAQGLEADVRLHPLLASVALDFPLGTDPERVVRLAQGLASLPCTLHAREAWLHARLQPATAGPARELSLRLKQSLDPDGVFAARPDGL